MRALVGADATDSLARAPDRPDSHASSPEPAAARTAHLLTLPEPTARRRLATTAHDRARALPMSLVSAVVVFVVGLLSGVVVRWVAGLAAIVALVLVLLGVSSLDVALVGFVLEQYYRGNELLFLAGLLFGIDSHNTRTAVERRRRAD